jgi:hypothetical protein
MTNKRRPKKSEALEIRVSHEEKQAFMQAVRSRDTTASDVMRHAMHLFVKNGELRRRNIMISSALAASALAIAFVGLSGNSSGEDMSGLSSFNQIDANVDRELSFEEFSDHKGTARFALGPDSSPAEFGAAAGVLLARYGDAVPDDFTQQTLSDPNSISSECWAAVESAWQAHVNDSFVSMDADGNGRVTFAEYRDRATTQLRRAFDHLDVDGSLTLDLTELVPNEEAADENNEHNSSAYPAFIEICFGDRPVTPSEPISAERREYLAGIMMRYYDVNRNNVVEWDEYRAANN